MTCPDFKNSDFKNDLFPSIIFGKCDLVHPHSQFCSPRGPQSRVCLGSHSRSPSLGLSLQHLLFQTQAPSSTPARLSPHQSPPSLWPLEPAPSQMSHQRALWARHRGYWTEEGGFQGTAPISSHSDSGSKYPESDTVQQWQRKAETQVSWPPGWAFFTANTIILTTTSTGTWYNRCCASTWPLI